MRLGKVGLRKHCGTTSGSLAHGDPASDLPAGTLGTDAGPRPRFRKLERGPGVVKR